MKRLISFKNGETAIIDGLLKGISISSNTGELDSEYNLESLSEDELNKIKVNPKKYIEKIKAQGIDRK